MKYFILQNLKNYFLLLGLILMIQPLNAQIFLEVNGSLEFELSKGGGRSHFYYNGIHAKHLDWRVGPSEANLVTSILFSKNWSVNNRLIMLRDDGDKFDQFILGQLNLQWNSDNEKYQINIGRFKNPFGLFNNQQLPTDRLFIDRPLPYSFYTNISQYLGYMEGQGWNNISSAAEGVDWGRPTIYWGGYADGIKFVWDIKKDKTLLEVAIVNGANNSSSLSFSPINLGMTSRLSHRVKYNLETGFSFSHGRFILRDEVNEELENITKYSQTMFGTDFKYGKGFFELSGEAMYTLYKVPSTTGDTSTTGSLIYQTSQHLGNFSGYMNLRYDLPFLPGVYGAYQFGLLTFGKDKNGNAWDENVWRHTLGVGYEATTYLLIKINYSIQAVKNRDWDQTAFRTSVVGFF